jgi:RNA polymerase sigma-70 factor (TIGR02943 family)
MTPIQHESGVSFSTKEHLMEPKKWVSNHADYLYSYAMSRLNDEDLARDIVQDTFLAALERVDRFEGRSTERTWLTAILKHKVVDQYRKRSSGIGRNTERLDDPNSVDVFFESEDGHWKSQYQPKSFGIEEQDPMHAKEFNMILQKCMQKLPSLWLSVFTMKHIDDETTEMICHELKVTPSNFWVIIHRTKVDLRNCLQKNWI